MALAPVDGFARARHLVQVALGNARLVFVAVHDAVGLGVLAAGGALGAKQGAAALDKPLGRRRRPVGGHRQRRPRTRLDGARPARVFLRVAAGNAVVLARARVNARHLRVQALRRARRALVAAQVHGERRRVGRRPRRHVAMRDDARRRRGRQAMVVRVQAVRAVRLLARVVGHRARRGARRAVGALGHGGLRGARLGGVFARVFGRGALRHARPHVDERPMALLHAVGSLHFAATEAHRVIAAVAVFGLLQLG